jgi:hypothetical protein
MARTVMALPGSVLAGQAASPATTASPAARLTGRGAVIGMAVLFTVGLLAASWLGVTVLAGIFFVLGCALAAWFTRPADLLIVVLTPPILFTGALILVEVVTASGSLLLSVAAGGVVVIVSLALWLAAGLAVTVAVAVPRGLMRCVGDLLRDLAAERARRQRSGQPGPGRALANLLRRLAHAGDAGPKPEGPGGARAGVRAAGRPGPAATRAAGRTASAPAPPRRPPPR